MTGKTVGRRSLAWGFPVFLVLGACVNTTYVPTGVAYPPRVASCEIEIFSSALPDGEYEELGIIEGEGSFWKADMEDLVPELKEEACRAGGEGLILHSAQRYASGEEGIENMYAFATVIRWKR